jgi:hypothetical protein
MDKNDFLMLFSVPITQAKNEIMNQEAIMHSTIKSAAQEEGKQLQS